MKNWVTGARELYKSLFPEPYVKLLQEYIPEIQVSSLREEKASGVRAQALDQNGNLVEDFVFDSNPEWKSVLHVRNAPSPGATSSLAIAREIIDMAEKQFALK